MHEHARLQSHESSLPQRTNQGIGTALAVPREVMSILSLAPDVNARTSVGKRLHVSILKTAGCNRKRFSRTWVVLGVPRGSPQATIIRSQP